MQKPLSFLILLIFIFNASLSAGTVQVIHDGYPSNWGGGGSININGVSLLSSGGSITKMYIKQSTNSGTGKTWTYTLVKNGSDTSMTCTISGASATTCEDTVNSVTVSADDYLWIKAAPTSSPNTVNVATAIVFAPTTDGDTVMWTNGPGQVNGPVNFGFSGFGNPGYQTSGEAAAAIKIASAGTIDKLYVKLSSTMAAGTSMTYTLYKNGSSTSLTCTTSASSSGCSDTTNSVTVSEGDLVSILQSSLTGWPPNTNTRRISVNFNPTTDGEFVTGLSQIGGVADLSTTNTQYLDPMDSYSDPSTTSTDRQNIVRAATAKRLYVSLTSAPGSGKSRAFTLRVNGSDSSLTCTISDTATNCSGATDVTLSDGDWINIKTVPTGTPAASDVTVSMAEYIAPTGGGGESIKGRIISTI